MPKFRVSVKAESAIRRLTEHSFSVIHLIQHNYIYAGQEEEIEIGLRKDQPDIGQMLSGPIILFSFLNSFALKITLAYVLQNFCSLFEPT